LLLFCGTIAGTALWNLERGLQLINLLVFAVFGVIVVFKVLSVVVGLFSHDIERADPGDMSRIRDADWPVYTVLIPLYHEAAIVADLLSALGRLDYPRDKLDVKWLIEEDDEDTALAIRLLTLPRWIEVVVVPKGEPRTKPRACNEGLQDARGEFTVVFDAEDRPEPDQLKKAVAIFRRSGDSIVCLQAKLNYYNPDENLLTRWFTLEYTTWFDLYLPGLHTLKAPIPLGGTSNHFRTSALRGLDGWDAWNVTEDCDLGLRLARAGYETHIMDSTTWEEAVSRLGPWIRQRSRWTKGYWQTLLANTRAPLHAFRELGAWKLFQVFLVVAGQVFSLLLAPVSWILLGVWAFMPWPLFHPEAPWTLALFVVFLFMLLCNVLFVVIHTLGAWQRKQYWLTKTALLLPFYWILMGIGAWRGMLQHLWAPFKWEKTPHGADARPAPVRRVNRRALENKAVAPKVRWVTSVVIAFLFAGVVWVSVSIPQWLEYYRQVREARIDISGAGDVDEKHIDVCWTYCRVLTVDLQVPSAAKSEPDDEPVFRALVFLKVLDWEWYQTIASRCEVHDGIVSIRIPLTPDAGWAPIHHKRPWGPWCLRRVRSVGVRLFQDGPAIKGARILRMSLEAGASPDLAITILHAPAQSAQLA